MAIDSTVKRSRARLMVGACIITLISGCNGAQEETGAAIQVARVSDVEAQKLVERAGEWSSASESLQKLSHAEAKKLLLLEDPTVTLRGTVVTSELLDARRRASISRDRFYSTLGNDVQGVLSRLSEDKLTVIADPLYMAFEGLDLALNERLDGSLRTDIQSLLEHSQHDVIGDRLMLDYGSAITRRRNEPSVYEAFVNLTRELILLSSEQLARLDSVLYEEATATNSAITGSNRFRIDQRFRWAIAPLFLTIADLCKHRGDDCRAIEWLADNRSDLLAAIDGFGWATGNVYLYSRASGQITGFVPQSTFSGQLGSQYRAVDLQILIDSLLDPRAVGLGDCAIAGMITRGIVSVPPKVQTGRTGALPQNTATTPRYVCPAFPCRDPSERFGAVAQTVSSPLDLGAYSPKGGLAASQLRDRWGSVSDDDISQMQTTTSLCGGGTGLNQGELPWVGERNCMYAEVFASSAGSSFDYAACISETVVGDAPGSLFTGFTVNNYKGVPGGLDCRLIQDGGDAPATGEEESEEETNTGAEGDDSADGEENDEVRKQLLEQVKRDFHKGCGTGGSWSPEQCNKASVLIICLAGREAACAGPKTNEPGSDSSNPTVSTQDQTWTSIGECTEGDCEPGQSQSLPSVFCIDGNCKEWNDLTESELTLTINRLPEALAESDSDLSEGEQNERFQFALRLLKGRLRQLEAARERSQDCVDPSMCESTCSAIGEQIASANQCATDMLDFLAEALGMARRGIPETRIESIAEIQPRPDADLGSSSTGQCLRDSIAEMSSWRALGNCALVHCPDAAPGGGDGCCGLSTNQTGQVITNKTCETLRCRPDEPCECFGESI